MMTLLDQVIDIVVAYIVALGYWGIGLGMAIESANVPLPSEIILPFGGYLVSTDELRFWGVVLAGTVGGTVGSVFSYALGAWGGRPLVLRYGRYAGVSAQKLNIADQWFARYGEATVFFTRMMPVVRTFISLPAGISRMHFRRFVIYTFLGSLPWSIALTYVGYQLGENWQSLKPLFHRLDLLVVGVLAITVLYFGFRTKQRLR